MSEDEKQSDHPVHPVIREIITERWRQVIVHGWTKSHDDAHKHGEMALAGMCYAQSAASLLGTAARASGGFHPSVTSLLVRARTARASCASSAATILSHQPVRYGS